MRSNPYWQCRYLWFQGNKRRKHPFKFLELGNFGSKTFRSLFWPSQTGFARAVASLACAVASLARAIASPARPLTPNRPDLVWRNLGFLVCRFHYSPPGYLEYCTLFILRMVMDGGWWWMWHGLPVWFGVFLPISRKLFHMYSLLFHDPLEEFKALSAKKSKFQKDLQFFKKFRLK